ncbi:hypothetical protein AN958_02558 [Leucoagaricus sp. SymC.cos]|nr:hypothetical protein AN958_02558 [Leucoagaricus sp. SymC.cos]
MPSSSTTYASSASSASASASSSARTSASSHDPRNVVVGCVLGIVGLILLVGILILTLRVRRRQKSARNSVMQPFHGSAVLDKRHPAARIVPFGTPGAEGHYYRHTPGKDMRIAIRRPDGAWDFTDPNQPFTPNGVTDIVPSPVSSTATFSSISKRQQEAPPAVNRGSAAILAYKEQESRAAQMIRLGYDARDHDLAMGDGPLPYPPPAYGQEPTVGPYVTFRLSNNPPRNVPAS